MITDSSRVLVSAATLAAVMALVFGVVSGEPTGVALLVGLAVAALSGAVGLSSRSEREVEATVDGRAGAGVSVAEGAGSVVHPVATDALRPVSSGMAPLGVAVGVVLVATAFVAGVVLAILGFLVAAFAWLAWLAQATGEHRGRAVDLSPLAIPIGALVGVGGVMVLMSRILLSVTPHASTAIAIAIATLLLLACWLVASWRDLRPGPLTAAAVVAALALLGGGIAGAVHGQRVEEPAGSLAAPLAISAHNITFNRSELDLSAGKTVAIQFKNLDVGTYHNVALYTDQTFSHALFNGRPIDRGVIEYRVIGLKVGTYAFHCDFHANMRGVVNVS